jgi:hypothetical protein
MITARALLLLLLATGVRAQTTPAASANFVWEGDVDESAVLYLRGDHLEVENPRGEHVLHQRYRFFHLPPDSRQRVRLDILEGRGTVQITQQPALDNDYTIIVDIADRQEGRAHYSIALYWDSPADENQEGARKWQDRGWQGDSVAEPRGAVSKLTWRGHVDSEAVVECRASSCHSLKHEGMPVSHERVHFDQPLPRQEVVVNLAGDDANGNTRVLQQPLRSNGYAVEVEITGGCGAKKDCTFTLTWREAGAAEPQAAAHRGMVWVGRVNGVARVTVRGSSTLSQGTVTAERADFDRALPAQSGLPAAVRKLQGRGAVAIVESPSDENGYSLVFEVRDPGPGADDYVVEVDW